MLFALVWALQDTDAAVSRSVGAAGTPPPPSRPCVSARKGLVWYQAATRRWYAQMDKRITPRQRPRNCTHARRLADNWHGRAVIARQTFEAWFIAIYRKWECIHEHEGSWTDDGAPYWGGLQFSDWFQRHYGPEFYARWGTANHWPIWAQLVAAERAWRESGFRQWGTAGRCGLR